MGVLRRTLIEEWNEGEAPDKVQRISSICVGYGAADKKGEIDDKEYEDDMPKMAEEYKARDEVGEFFVHIRKKHSSNRT